MHAKGREGDDKWKKGCRLVHRRIRLHEVFNYIQYQALHRIVGVCVWVGGVSAVHFHTLPIRHVVPFEYAKCGSLESH